MKLKMMLHVHNHGTWPR